MIDFKNVYQDYLKSTYTTSTRTSIQSHLRTRAYSRRIKRTSLSRFYAYSTTTINTPSSSSSLLLSIKFITKQITTLLSTSIMTTTTTTTASTATSSSTTSTTLPSTIFTTDPITFLTTIQTTNSTITTTSPALSTDVVTSSRSIMMNSKTFSMFNVTTMNDLQNITRNTAFVRSSESHFTDNTYTIVSNLPEQNIWQFIIYGLRRCRSYCHRPIIVSYCHPLYNELSASDISDDHRHNNDPISPSNRIQFNPNNNFLSRTLKTFFPDRSYE